MFRESRAFRVGDFSPEKILAWQPPEGMLRYVPGGLYGAFGCARASAAVDAASALAPPPTPARFAAPGVDHAARGGI